MYGLTAHPNTYSDSDIPWKFVLVKLRKFVTHTL